MDISFEEKLNDLIKLKEYTDKAVANALNNIPEEKFRSDDIAELATAFAKAQGKYPVIIYNRESSMFQNEYTDLDLIMFKIRPVLTSEGLFFNQITRFSKDGITLLDSFLFHCSGQWNSSVCKITVDCKGSADPLQAYVKALTYMKKYVFGAYFVLHTGSEK